MSQAAAELLVFYPSGAIVAATGRVGWADVMGDGSPEGRAPAIDLTAPCCVGDRVLEAGSVLVCDPRSVVVACDRLDVLYHPRMPTVVVPPVLAGEMAQDWPDAVLARVERMRRLRAARRARARRVRR